MRNIIRITSFAGLVLGIITLAGAWQFNKETPIKKETTTIDAQLEGTIHAPEIPPYLEWLNTDRRHTLRDFRGKLVLLDFWTFCCINCMHVIPDLKKLETKYPEELVVIGIHSAKFSNEKKSRAIQQAIERLEIEHPVVNDNNFEVWNSYGVRAWPSLVLINPNGKIIGTASGEGVFEVFDPVIQRAITYFDNKGELKRDPLLTSTKSHETETALSFPGKVSADKKNKRLFISDTNHNRIIITKPDGTILDTIGGRNAGNRDGSFTEARFNHPQGTFLHGDILYIADTENHAIRAANLTTHQVKTILGTGEQAKTYNIPGTGTEVALNSPWDVLVHENRLYIAMAGSHQIWEANLATMQAQPYAGSAYENITDGFLLDAALAQPSGITTDGVKLYFADSETSSIRWAELKLGGVVKTIIGAGLFEYGDIDDKYPHARLQHPLGIAYRDGLIYVADTYNSKIKVIDPNTKTSTTFAGTGEKGLRDGNKAVAQFDEPGGMTFIGDSLYIADTNNHAIRVLDMNTGMVTTMVLQ